MSQATNVIAAGSGLAVRTAINSALAAINSGHSGTAAPSYIAGGMLYWRTDVPGSGTWTLYAYDGSSSVAVGTLNTSTHVWTPANALAATILTTQGDFMYRDASAAARLAAGSDAYKAIFSGGSGANPTMAGTWKVLGEATPSGAASVDFTGIPAGVHHIMVLFELLNATDSINWRLRTYGADGVLDTGGSDYNYVVDVALSSGATGIGSATGAYIAFTSTNAVSNNSAWSTAGYLMASNIQAARSTRIHSRVSSLLADGNMSSVDGVGVRIESDRITGLSIYPSSGNCSGRALLLGSSN